MKQNKQRENKAEQMYHNYYNNKNTIINKLHKEKLGKEYFPCNYVKNEGKLDTYRIGYLQNRRNFSSR